MQWTNHLIVLIVGVVQLCLWRFDANIHKQAYHFMWGIKGCVTLSVDTLFD